MYFIPRLGRSLELSTNFLIIITIQYGKFKFPHRLKAQ